MAGVLADSSAAQLLATAGEHAALVRFSRPWACRGPLPELLGMSIRVLDGYGRGLGTGLPPRELCGPAGASPPVPAREGPAAAAVKLLTALPAGTQRFIVRALLHADFAPPAGDTELERVRIAAATHVRRETGDATPVARESGSGLVGMRRWRVG